jgi:methylated-DNA-[protein]-cysteine S-methyltransferase
VTARGLSLFDTAIGRCAVVWGERGITSVHLPEASEGRLRARLRRTDPGVAESTPPPAVHEAVARMVALLDGGADDLADVVLDLDGVSTFERDVYALARAIPPGETSTYGQVAAQLGDPGAARAVGGALGRNPCPIVVPCHRVVAAGGRMGGFSAPGGADTKRRMLIIEGAAAAGPPTLFDL